MPKKFKVNIFDDLREALQDAADYERGVAVNLRVTSVHLLRRRLLRNRFGKARSGKTLTHIQG